VIDSSPRILIVYGRGRLRHHLSALVAAAPVLRSRRLSTKDTKPSKSNWLLPRPSRETADDVQPSKISAVCSFPGRRTDPADDSLSSSDKKTRLRQAQGKPGSSRSRSLNMFMADGAVLVLFSRFVFLSVGLGSKTSSWPLGRGDGIFFEVVGRYFQGVYSLSPS